MTLRARVQPDGRFLCGMGDCGALLARVNAHARVFASETHFTLDDHHVWLPQWWQTDAEIAAHTPPGTGAFMSTPTPSIVLPSGMLADRADIYRLTARARRRHRGALRTRFRRGVRAALGAATADPALGAMSVSLYPNGWQPTTDRAGVMDKQRHAVVDRFPARIACPACGMVNGIAPPT